MPAPYTPFVEKKADLDGETWGRFPLLGDEMKRDSRRQGKQHLGAAQGCDRNCTAAAMGMPENAVRARSTADFRCGRSETIKRF